MWCHVMLSTGFSINNSALFHGDQGCLSLVRKIRLVWPLHNGKGFSEYVDQPEEIALTIKLPYWTTTKTTRRSLKGPGNGKLKQMVRKFPTFRSERKKGTTSGGSPQFPNGFSGKLPFHLTLNRNFQIFWLNGKHPRCLVYPGASTLGSQPLDWIMGPAKAGTTKQPRHGPPRKGTGSCHTDVSVERQEKEQGEGLAEKRLSKPCWLTYTPLAWCENYCACASIPNWPIATQAVFVVNSLNKFAFKCINISVRSQKGNEGLRFAGLDNEKKRRSLGGKKR